MDTFVCSSWYFFRFIDPRNDRVFADPERLQKIAPVDFYIGGAEHTVLHLLYARFFTKVAYDAGIIDYDEPFLKLRHQGLILGPDHRKMSKRWGNVINPNDIVSEYGADTLRMYEMFMGPLDQMKAWSDGGVRGIRRFLQRVWDTAQQVKQPNEITEQNSQAKIQSDLNKLIEKVGSDINNLKFNTAVSEFMKFINTAYEQNLQFTAKEWKIFLILLFPFAPFLASELWELVAGDGSEIEDQSWPVAMDVVVDFQEDVTIAVMINGKLRDRLMVHKGTQKSTVLELALTQEKVKKYTNNGDQGSINKIIFIEDKVLNLVVK
jgi:leucyl-tRNA synthetase